MRFVLFIVAVSLVGGALAHHPDPGEVADDTVIARVPISDPSELDLLRRDHVVLTYAWRLGQAMIQATPDRLPANAVIDAESTARLHGRYQVKNATRGSGIPGFSCYRTVEETQADLVALAAAHPDLAEWVDYGDSWSKSEGAGGYDLTALIITNELLSPDPGGDPKPILMIMAAMHARELTTAETATRFAEHLLAGYGTDPDITWLVDHNEIHILPQHNPDGRKQAETGQFWRKNVNENYCSPTSSSRGADLNRNAATLFWGGAASSGSQCSDSFRGPAPGSEPETAALEAYQLARFPDQRDGDIGVGAPEDAQGIFISLHSSGEFVFYPWEGVDTDTGNEDGYRSLSQRLGFITGYAACQNCCLGPAGGTAVDFAYEELGVASFTFELGTEFFQSCTDFENEIWPANRNALIYATKAARRPYQSSHGPVVHDLQISWDPDGETATLTAQVDDGRYAVNNPCPPVDATQTSVTITEIRYTVDLPPWEAAGQPMSAVDGAFDSSSEEGTVDLSASQLGIGRHLVYVQAVDANGQSGPPSAVFVEFPVLFADGFE